MNGLLCGAGHNLRKIPHWAALLFALILDCLQRPVQKRDANRHQLMVVVC